MNIRKIIHQGKTPTKAAVAGNWKDVMIKEQNISPCPVNFQINEKFYAMEEKN